MAESVSEKVVRLETQMANVTTEVLEVKGLVKEVIKKVDNFTNIQNEVAALKVEVYELKKTNARNRWLVPTAVGAAVSVIAPIFTLLIVSYIQNAGR